MKSCEGELNENKTYIRIDIAGPGGSGCPAKCRDRDREVLALAVFAAPGTDDTCVNGGGTHSRVTFRNLIPQLGKSEDQTKTSLFTSLQNL